MDRLEHAIVKLMEECGEVTQRCAKILRFGLHETQQGALHDNMWRLHFEVLDIVAAIEVLRDLKALPRTVSEPSDVADRIKRIEHYLEYSKAQGCFTPPAECMALAHEVYNYINGQVESFEHDDMVGPDLAYLLGAMLNSTHGKPQTCEWPSDRPIIKLLADGPFPHDHKVWKHIEIEDDAVTDVDCCENPKRNLNGGCDNCGDPCL